MLNQFAVEIPTLPVDQCHSHLIRNLKGCWDLLSYRRAAKIGCQAFGTHGISGNVFANPHGSSSAPCPQELNQWNTSIGRAAPFIHSGEMWKARTKSRSEMPVWTVSQRFSHLQWRRLFKELWADQQRLQILDLHFDKFPTPATFACWEKVQDREYVLVRNFVRKRCNGSKKWRWLIQWMI